MLVQNIKKYELIFISFDDRFSYCPKIKRSKTLNIVDM